MEVQVYWSTQTRKAHPPLLTSGCSSCRGRRGTVWPGLCCCLVWRSRCVCWPGCAARPGCWWCKPELTRGMRCSGAKDSNKRKHRKKGQRENQLINGTTNHHTTVCSLSLSHWSHLTSFRAEWKLADVGTRRISRGHQLLTASDISAFIYFCCDFISFYKLQLWIKELTGEARNSQSKLFTASLAKDFGLCYNDWLTTTNKQVNWSWK